jgi:hypothetical protein
VFVGLFTLMIEIAIKDKQKYLNENYPFAEPPKMIDLKECIHCGSIITVGDYKANMLPRSCPCATPHLAQAHALKFLYAILSLMNFVTLLLELIF